MPPKPSTSSNEKMKSGKKKEDSKPNDREGKEQDDKTKKLAEEFLATPLGRSLGITDELVADVAEKRIAAAGGVRALSTPDNPPCDGCKKPFAGTMQCGRCESVFYCDRDCQVSHWSAGHKTECKHLKKENEDTAQRVLSEFKEFRGWKVLDVVGAYKAAVRQGLYDKIREVMELDKAEIVNRYRSGPVLISYAQCVMSVLFRGQRAEGRAGARSPAYKCVDGPRIKGYVRSHPDALDAWLQASVQVNRAVTDPATLRDSHRRNAVIFVAQEVWACWGKVFECSIAARAVLEPFPSKTKGATDGGSEASAEQLRKRGEDHARRIVKAFGEAIRLVETFSDASFVHLLFEVKMNVHSAAAMVHVRTEEYGIDIDVEGILNLEEGPLKDVFQHFTVPMAKATIEKGGALNAQEGNAIMAQTSRALGLHEMFAQTGM